MKDLTNGPRQEKNYFNKLTRISPVANFAILAFLCVVAVLVIVPIVLVVVISFSSEYSIGKIGYSFFPTEWSLEAYEYLIFGDLGTQIFQSYGITAAQAILGTVLSLLVMSLYGYVLAQRNFAGKKFYTLLIFITMLFGGGLVPSYIVNTQILDLYDSFWVFILPGLISGYSVIILRTFINSTVPDEMLEAAKIDGANHFIIYSKIVMPLSKAGLAVVALWSIVGKWNDWFTATLYIENPKLVPLQTMLTRIQANIDFIKNNSALAASPEGAQILSSIPSDSTRMAIVIISILPIMFAYPFFQRYFVQGITVGSVKG